MILAYIFYWAPKQHKKAELAIYKAEQYFAKDSLQLALNGDGTCDGLLTIIDKYSLTKTADRACFMAGVCFLKDGKYDEAIKYLKKYSAKLLFIGNKRADLLITTFNIINANSKIVNTLNFFIV